MKLIKPITATQAKIASYNVTQTEQIWSSATTYAKGARVVLDSFGLTVYESLIDSNLNKAPATNQSSWLAVGASNYAAMFDAKNGTQTTRTDSIVLTIKTNELINAIGLVNLDASSVRVQMVDTTAGTVYDKTIHLKTLPATDWYGFYFGEFIQKDNAVFANLPPYRNASITVTITSYATGGIAKVGTIALGKLETIGYAQWGVKLGFVDYSRKEADDFGNYTIVQRSHSNTMDVDIRLETSKIPTVQRLRSELRAMPVVWVASELYTETTAFGFFGAFDINLSNPILSTASITINGLT
jgi:hypothetical protein